MTCSAFCAIHWCFGIEGLRATAKILWDHRWDTSAVNAQWKLKPEATSPVRVSPSCRKSEPSRLEPVSVAAVMIGWRPFSLAALRSQLLAWFQRDCFSVGNGLLNVLHTVSLLYVLCISIYPILCLLPFCYPWYGLGIAQ